MCGLLRVVIFHALCSRAVGTVCWRLQPGVENGNYYYYFIIIQVQADISELVVSIKVYFILKQMSHKS